MKKGDFDFINFDSLLDTLFCVVGILIILMVFSQLGVVSSNGDKPQSKISLTEQDIALKEIELVKLEAELRSRRERWGRIEAKLPEWIKEEAVLLEEVKTLRKSLPNLNSITKKLYPVRKLVFDLEKKEQVLRRETNILKKRLNELRNNDSYGQTEFAIRIPEIRNPPENLLPISFVCRYGRLYPLEPESISKAFGKFLSFMRNRRSKQINNLYDTIKYYFVKNDVGDRFFRMSINQILISPRVSIQIELIPRNEKGLAIEEIKEDNSYFINLIKKINIEVNYIHFRVYEDSFDIYLLARKMAESLHATVDPNSGAKITQLNAGWTPYKMADSIAFLYPPSSRKIFRPKID